MRRASVTRDVRVGLFAALAMALALIAWVSPAPDRVTDRVTYEATARDIIVPDCSELHCFRVLVPWVLGRLPGPSLVKWKAFAVLGNAAAGVAVYTLTLAWGLSRRAAGLAAFASAFGFGALYTVHDAFTADPAMYALGPVVALLLLGEGVALAGVIAAVGVTAKEFVAVPLYVAAVAGWLDGRREFAARAVVAATAAFLVWLALQLTLIVGFNYGYGENPSTHLLSGGYLAPWIVAQSPRGALSAFFNEFGALWILAPAGWWLAPAGVRRYTVIAAPFAALFAYVQQPDRALWNFHFVAAPLAAMVLERVPWPLAWSTLVTFALANLRVGAQLTGVPVARVPLAVSTLLAVACCVLAWRAPGTAAAPSMKATGSPGSRGPGVIVALALALETAAVAVLLLVALDQYAHKRVENLGGVNARGYRGAILKQKRPDELRVAVAGGDMAFGWGVAVAETPSAYLRTRLDETLNHPGGPSTFVTTVGLGAHGLPAREYAARIERYGSLAADLLVLYVDLADSRVGSVMPPFDSATTVVTGYVPMLPIVLDEKGERLSAAGGVVTGALLSAAGRALRAIDRAAYAVVRRESPPAGDRRAAIERAFDASLETAPVVVVVPPPVNDQQRAEHERIVTAARARALAAPGRFRLVDLAEHPGLSDPGLRLDGAAFSAAGNSLAADAMAPVVLDALPSRFRRSPRTLVSGLIGHDDRR